MLITEFMRDIHDFQSELSRMLSGGYGAYPRVRISETGHEVLVEAQLAGVDPDKIEVTVTDDVLTISGETPARALEEGGKEPRILRRERAHGKFTRSIELPKAVDANVSAEFQDGILSISLPIREEAKPKKITVKTK